MRHHLSFIFMFAFCFLSQVAEGHTGSISGRAADESGKPLVFANVILLKDSNSAFVKTELTDEKGDFKLTPVENGFYKVKVVFTGYTTWQSGRITVADKDVSINEIKLTQAETKLREVAVTAERPFIEVKADKLVVNVENSIVSTGATVMEVLAQSPGVSVDQNDNVSLKGKQGVNIMINGRTIPVSGTELANMLKSMPANSVEKIELISNPSAKYDAAGTAGIINIKTRKDKRMGLNGTVTAGYGQGVYAKENAGISLNYRNKNFNAYLSYNLDNRMGMHPVTFNRNFYRNDTFTGAYRQNNNTVISYQTHNVAIGADYSIGSKTSVGVSVNADDLKLGTNGYFFSNVIDQADQLQSWFATNNTSMSNWYNVAPNLHLQHTFDSVGTQLNVDLDYAGYRNANTQDFTTKYYALTGLESKPPYILHADISGKTTIASIKADYTHPLKKGGSLDGGIKLSYVTANNEPRFFNRSSGVDQYDSSKSDHFIYTENINAAYINASKDWKKWSTQLGLRAEQTIVTGDEKVTGQTFSNSYLKLFPSLAAQRHINSSNDLGVTLSRRIERPGYEDLNPYKYYVDPSTFKEGNPYLNPALTYAAELSHVYKQRFITTLSYSITDQVITEALMPSTVLDRVTIQTKANLATMRYIGLSGSYTIQVAKWWVSINNFNAYYSHYEGSLANTNLSEGSPTFDINTNNKFTFQKNWVGEAGFFYQAPQVYGFLNLKQMSMFSLGIQKSMFDKKLTVRLRANDIFWHGNPSGSAVFNNYNESFVSRHDSRQVNLSLSYRFGNKGLAPVHKHSGGAEEEKTRAKSSAG